MEIRSISKNANPNFGMAFIKPSEEVMRVLEKQVDGASIGAFVREQSKAKHFDIIATLAQSDKVGGSRLMFEVRPKYGAQTLGYECGEKFYSDGNYEKYSAKIARKYSKSLNKIEKNCTNAVEKFFYRKIIVPIANFCYKREIKDVRKNHPARLIMPALRAAGDEVNKLESQIKRANDIANAFEV